MPPRALRLSVRPCDASIHTCPLTHRTRLASPHHRALRLRGWHQAAPICPILPPTVSVSVSATRTGEEARRVPDVPAFLSFTLLCLRG